MNFDIVHDTQNVYREVVKAYSNPGRIISIKENSEKLDYQVELNKGILALSLMFLDREVTHKVVPFDGASHLLKHLTYSIEDENGDYIIITNKASKEEIIEAIRNSKEGDLIDPHKSATIIFEVDYLNNEKKLALSGPGIESKTYANIPVDRDVLVERNNKNTEFPKGIDFIFIDKEYNIMAIPRTTKIWEV